MSKARDYSKAVAARLEWSKTYKNDTAGGVVYVEFDDGDVKVGTVTRDKEAQMYVPRTINGKTVDLTPKSNLKQAVKSILLAKGCESALNVKRADLETVSALHE
jgi:hypothetical protein